MMVYYRTRIFAGVVDFLTIGLLPAASIVLLGWVFAKTITQVPVGEVYTVLGVLGTGIVVMILERALRNPEFFRLPREKYTQQRGQSAGSAQG
jgi:predicted acyltransferase